MKKGITYDQLLAKIPNKYVLATVAGKRCREMQNGAEAMVKSLKKDTNVQKTFKEILAGKIGYDMQEKTGE
ncbi:DNA-directed RNA polymerase subunit omega [uncultured Ilyobacter sp.]|uniref:DNA-directed RNA polymerase subunit omega n=1 Tax=uncultured Ilyobacter sp. TaxID=544433 RepID=UPI0029C98BB4|nr:DNA-directed RNA polymerase subunit omega [uncultured Ilyobacter sp.]